MSFLDNFSRRTIFVFLSLAFSSCSHSPTDFVPETHGEKSTMYEEKEHDSPVGMPFNPKFNAEQVLHGLLQLIRSSQTIEDFTQERIRDVMGLETILYGPGHYGFDEQVTRQWRYGFEMKKTADDPRFKFSFNEERRGSIPPMTDICQIDFDLFAKELETMGFSQEKFYGSHGSRGWDRFDDHRSDHHRLSIEVYSRGEADEPTGKIAHDCIESIIIK